MSFESVPLPFSIACPNCQQKLKIQKQELLGKKVKCPKCKDPLMIVPPEQNGTKEEEVEFELVTDEPPEGTSAKWVPDEPAITPSQPPTADGPVIIPGADELSSSALHRLRKSRKKKKGPMLIVGAFLLAGIGTITYLVVNQPPPPEDIQKDVNQEVADKVELNANEPYSRALLENREQLVAEFEPTDGKPIELYMMPSGVNFLIHFRPALLWSSERDYQILKASLTDRLTGSAATPGWIEETLVKVCRRKPEQIEEVLIGFIIGARGTKPDVCAVVRLKEPEKMSDLIDEFDGTYLYDITERPELRLKVDGEYGYLIKDEKTFAIVPEHLAGELEFSIDVPNRDVSEAMDQLLRETDRKRLFTAVGNLGDLQRHVDSMFPEPSQRAFSLLFEWFGEEIEAAAWSLHMQPYLHSEVNLRVINTSSPAKVQTRLESELAELPQTMWKEVCEKMSPQEVGFRSLIGRLPAMLEAFQQSTIISTSGRSLKLTTVLPQKAAPNLALATLLTVDEATRTDFTKDVVVRSSGPKLPETVAGRLKLPVDAEFNRRPLEQALQYLAGEIQVTLKVDGEALEDAGYTRNMPQTFTLGIVAAERAFAEIIRTSQDEGKELVISAEDSTMSLHFTTKKFAERRGLEIYPLEID